MTAVLLVLLAAAGGCGDDDEGVDAALSDSGLPDAGLPDTAPPDAAEDDAGPGDAGPGDAGDAGVDCTFADPPMIGRELIADGLVSPVLVAQAPGSTDTLWIVEKRGVIVLYRQGMGLLSAPFLDIRSTIGPEPLGTDERGLLGLTFHPDYETNGRFFVSYAPTRVARNVIAEFARDPTDPDRASATAVQTLVDIADPAENHNGGSMVFGPDGFLYAGIGDGGGGCDSERPGPEGNGQALDTLLGKILRLDVDAAPDFVAAGNPFEGGGGLPQIWAYGVRNPWRFSFDRTTGDFFIGDVGENTLEEIDVQPAGTPGGRNYGWRVFEASQRATASSGCPDEMLVGTHTRPVTELRQNSKAEILRYMCAIVGGYVYRGSAIPGLAGWYVYGDFCSRDLGAFRYCDGRAVSHQRLLPLDVGVGVASFGEDNAGELYMVSHSDPGGAIFRLIAR